MKNLEGQINLFDVPEVSGSSALKVAKDFGEHIGGARKELWSSRGLSLENILEMNEAEREKFIKKDQIWKKPDYCQMIEDGVPVAVAYGIKKVRDAVPTKPVIFRADAGKEGMKEKRQENYISFVTLIKEAFMPVKSIRDFIDAYDAVKVKIIDKDYLGSYYVKPKEEFSGLLTTSLLHAVSATSYTFHSTYSLEAKRTQFGVKAENKLPAGWSIEYYDGKGYTKGEFKPNTYILNKGYLIIEKNIPSYQEAFELCKSIAKRVSGNRKKSFVPPQLERVERTGLADIRNGKDVIGDDFVRDFSIRGGEFGNWMSEKDAQASLNMAYDAFCDFADVLGIPYEKVSFGGRLSIAFGARGKGSAVAHYEPLREVINITKMKGAGSLGHELFHALDDIVGKKLGLSKMMTESKTREIPESVANVIKAMMCRPATLEEKQEEKRKSIETAEKYLCRVIDNIFPAGPELSDEDREKREELVEAIIADTNVPISESGKTRYSIGNFTTKPILALSDFKKQVTGRVISKECRMDIFYAWTTLSTRKEMDVNANTSVYSDYYVNSKEMDKCMAKDKFGYWSSTCEMFARAGACYLSDMIAAKGGKSDYLSGHSECCIGMNIDNNGDIQLVKAMPQGEERKRINQAISEMIEDLKTRELL